MGVALARLEPPAKARWKRSSSRSFATALALSQVTTAPDAVRHQDSTARSDQPQVAQLLRAGCTHMRKAFDIEDINLDELIATALDDPQAIGESKAFRGINFADLHTAYRQFCKNEKVAVPAVDLGEVIDFYNKAVADLPDHDKLKGLKLPGASVVLDRKGERFAEVFEENQRRVWVVLADIPRARAEGLHRGRGPALLSAQGDRRARVDSRLHRQSRRSPDARRAARPSPSRS